MQAQALHTGFGRNPPPRYLNQVSVGCELVGPVVASAEGGGRLERALVAWAIAPPLTTVSRESSTPKSSACASVAQDAKRKEQLISKLRKHLGLDARSSASPCDTQEVSGRYQDMVEVYSSRLSQAVIAAHPGMKVRLQQTIPASTPIHDLMPAIQPALNTNTIPLFN